jgi:aromatic-L-amino-acid decarboxylase
MSMNNRYGDMDPEDFRNAAHQVADQIADYLQNLESYPVLPDIRPGDVKSAIPKEPPMLPQPWDEILRDYQNLVQPNITHWQHPGFMAYFPSSRSGR